LRPIALYPTQVTFWIGNGMAAFCRCTGI